jgi:hypothetical protein
MSAQTRSTHVGWVERKRYPTDRVHPLRCTTSFEEGLLETLEDKGDKGGSTEKEKYICFH